MKFGSARVTSVLALNVEVVFRSHTLWEGCSHYIDALRNKAMTWISLRDRAGPMGKKNRRSRSQCPWDHSPLSILSRFPNFFVALDLLSYRVKMNKYTILTCEVCYSDRATFYMCCNSKRGSCSLPTVLTLSSTSTCPRSWHHQVRVLSIFQKDATVIEACNQKNQSAWVEPHTYTTWTYNRQSCTTWPYIYYLWSGVQGVSIRVRWVLRAGKLHKT